MSQVILVKGDLITLYNYVRTHPEPRRFYDGLYVKIDIPEESIYSSKLKILPNRGEVTLTKGALLQHLKEKEDPFAMHTYILKYTIDTPHPECSTAHQVIKLKDYPYFTYLNLEYGYFN